jgi:hypothetical protein
LLSIKAPSSFLLSLSLSLSSSFIPFSHLPFSLSLYNKICWHDEIKY